jgi:hypothetical protein
MRRSTQQVGCLVSLAVMAISSTSFADTKWYDAVAINGHVQASYVGNLSKSPPQVNNLRNYDQETNSFNINQAQLKIAKPLGEDKYGFMIKTLMGRDVRVIKSVGTGDVDFDLQEAYATFACPLLKGVSYTAGKFVTSFGMEVIESPVNAQISPGFLFFYGMPFTHTGLKANYVLNDKLNMTAGVVNGWDTAADNNPGKTIIWQFATIPMSGSYLNLQGSYGPELLANNDSKRTALDITAGTSISKLSLGVEGLWGQDSNVTGGDSATTHWTGVGVWLGAGLQQYINPSIRFEVFDDSNGAGRLDTGAPYAAPVTTGLNSIAKNITVTNKFKMTDNAFMRVEYRHDFASEAIFSRDDGTGVTTQNTIGLDWVVTF